MPLVMPLPTLRILTLAAATVGGSVGAMAQTPAGNTVIQAKPGIETQAGVFGTPRPDCTVGPRPEVKVVATPTNGTLRVGPRTLRTSRLKDCQNLEVPVMAVFYTSKPSFVGADQVTLEVTSQNGRPETRTVIIEVR